MPIRCGSAGQRSCIQDKRNMRHAILLSLVFCVFHENLVFLEFQIGLPLPSMQAIEGMWYMFIKTKILEEIYILKVCREKIK